jgi:hypothetical protein
MTYKEKIRVLESCLNEKPKNYRDSFKSDLYLFFNEDFSDENPFLEFLNNYENSSEIEEWVDLVTSQIVLKFDEEFEQIGDFIGEFVELN